MKNLYLTLKFKPIMSITMLLALMLLNGCALFSKSQAPQNEVVNSNKSLKVADLTRWKIKGKLIFKSPKEKLSASLNWTQSDDESEIRLTTFLGISILKLVNNSSGATLTLDGNTYQSNDAQSLLYQKTGFNWPIVQLPMWIKGYSEVGERQYDVANKLKQINFQSDLTDNSSAVDWTIKYPIYQPVMHNGQSFDLPMQVRLTGHDMTIIIKIAQWQILP